MTPNFKTFIGESMWVDAHKKNIGIESRREDDINRLYKDDFFNYINDTYECTRPESQVMIREHYMSIPFFVIGFKMYRLTIVFKDDKLGYVHILANPKDCKEFFDDIKSSYDVEYNPHGGISIRGVHTNKECIELMDLIISKCSNPIFVRRESINK